ncbi:endospore germination permease [Paenibacillus lentus]|uniref:GerAB/ArcD/ProY family transporter n=1 Tax=Paenibacillus lentus TaxID=1338368 RepID=UPI003647B82F
MEKGRLSSRQLIVLALFVFVGDMALIYPVTMVSDSHQDAWIAGLISLPLGLAGIMIPLKVHYFYPQMNLIEKMNKILGKWVGTAVSLFYLFFFLIATSIYIREIEDFMTTQIFEKTPGAVFRFMILFLVIYGLRLGLETLGRAAEIFLPLFILFFTSLMILLLPQIRLENLFPMMNTPLPKLMHSVLYGISYPFGEMIVFLMVYPYVKHNKHTNRDIFLIMIIGSAVLNLILLLSLTVLGAYLSEHHFYTAYILAQKINIANFLQRIEALMAIVWVITTFFKTALYFYAFTHGTAQLFNLKSFRSLIFPVGFLVFGFSQLVSKDIIFYIKRIPAYWVDWDFTVCFAIPLLMMIVYYVRKTRTRLQQQKT